MKKLFLYSNYQNSTFLMPDDKTCSVNGVKLSVNEIIDNFRKAVKPYEALRCDLLNGFWDQSLNNGEGDYRYALIETLNISNISKCLGCEDKKYLISSGYIGNFLLSNIIDWIRNYKNFNIWVEHGSNKTYDLTTDLGCHRGSYKRYEDAQIEGIEIFVRNLQKINSA